MATGKCGKGPEGWLPEGRAKGGAAKGGSPKGRAPKGRAPKGRAPKGGRRVGQKISRFFFPLPPPFRSSCVSFGVFSLYFGCFFESRGPQMCPCEPPGPFELKPQRWPKDVIVLRRRPPSVGDAFTQTLTV